MFNCKIVIFLRESDERALHPFDTALPRCASPLYFCSTDTMMESRMWPVCSGLLQRLPGDLQTIVLEAAAFATTRPVNTLNQRQECVQIATDSLGVQPAISSTSPLNKPCSTCLDIFKCPNCLLLYGHSDDHKCPGKKCQVCGVKLESGKENFDDHLCYIQPLGPDMSNRKIIFYDFATFVDPLRQTRVPFLVSALSLDRKERFEAPLCHPCSAFV